MHLTNDLKELTGRPLYCFYWRSPHLLFLIYIYTHVFFTAYFRHFSPRLFPRLLLPSQIYIR